MMEADLDQMEELILEKIKADIAKLKQDNQELLTEILIRS